MATHYTNGDRILQAVLADPKLAELGEYTLTGNETIVDALDSENATIRAVAMIIDGNENQYTQKEIYTTDKYLYLKALRISAVITGKTVLNYRTVLHLSLVIMVMAKQPFSRHWNGCLIPAKTIKVKAIFLKCVKRK